MILCKTENFKKVMSTAVPLIVYRYCKRRGPVPEIAHMLLSGCCGEGLFVKGLPISRHRRPGRTCYPRRNPVVHMALCTIAEKRFIRFFFLNGL